MLTTPRDPEFLELTPDLPVIALGVLCHGRMEIGGSGRLAETQPDRISYYNKLFN